MAARGKSTKGKKKIYVREKKPALNFLLVYSFSFDILTTTTTQSESKMFILKILQPFQPFLIPEKEVLVLLFYICVISYLVEFSGCILLFM